MSRFAFACCTFIFSGKKFAFFQDFQEEFFQSLRRSPCLEMSTISDEKATIWNYKVPKPEYEARMDQLNAMRADSNEKSGFKLELQVRAYAQLDSYHKAILGNLFECFESETVGAAYALARKLYRNPLMSSESKGLLALAITFLSNKAIPRASIFVNATPFSSVAVDDWAYYLALARCKLKVGQYVQAGALLDLAAAVPHCHLPLVDQHALVCREQFNDCMHPLFSVLFDSPSKMVSICFHSLCLTI